MVILLENDIYWSDISLPFQCYVPDVWDHKIGDTKRWSAFVVYFLYWYCFRFINHSLVYGLYSTKQAPYLVSRACLADIQIFLFDSWKTLARRPHHQAPGQPHQEKDVPRQTIRRSWSSSRCTRVPVSQGSFPNEACRPVERRRAWCGSLRTYFRFSTLSEFFIR